MGRAALQGQVSWCAARGWDAGRSRQVPVFFSQEDGKGPPRSASLPSRASRHWVGGKSGQLSLRSGPPARSGPLPPGPLAARVRAQGSAAQTWVPRVVSQSCAARSLAPTSISTSATPAGWSFQPRTRRRFGKTGVLGCWNPTHGRLKSLSRGEQLLSGREVVRGSGTQPRRVGVTGLARAGSPKSSVPVLICSCSDFHCENGARTRVSSGRKRQFPPRGTDKDLIKGSKSRLFWPGARVFLSRITEGRGLSLAPLSQPQLSFPCHCGTPRPETGEEDLVRPH